MLSDEPLRQTPTHAAGETDGRAFGLELPRLKWVLLALLGGLLPGWACSEAFGLLWGAAVMFGPAVLVGVIQFTLFQGLPPGWLRDWFETRVTGAHLSPLRHF